MSNNMIISTAVAPVPREPDFRSELVTQGLMWESVSLNEEQDDWHGNPA